MNHMILGSAVELPILGNILREYLRFGPVELRWKRPEPQRSVEQNAKMWAMLTDVSEQVVWHGSKLQPEEWKDVFSAGLKKQRAVPGIDGGFVVLGTRTSKMSVKAMQELIELMQFFGSEHNVVWSKKEDVIRFDIKKAA